MQAQTAVRLTPASVTAIVDLGFAAYMAGRQGLALEHLTVALELGPQAPHTHFVMGMVQEARGDLATAADAYRQAVELSGGRRYVGVLGAALARLERVDEARALLAELSAAPPALRVSPIDFAVLCVALDDPDEAIRWLERLIDEHAWNVHILKAAPQLDPLRTDPRFATLLRRVGLAPDGSLARR